MSTTAAVVKLWQETGPDGRPKPEGRKMAIIGWAGDSRVYLLRGGTLERLTVDDTLLRDLVLADLAKQIEDKHDEDRYNRQEMRKTAVVLKRSNPADERLIGEIQRNPRGMAIPADTAASIEVPYSYFDFHAMTKTLSQNDLEPNIKTIKLQSEDRIIITSDGVHGSLLSSEMTDILNDPKNKNAATAAEALVRSAKKGELIPNVQSGSLKDDTTAIVVEIK